GPLPHRKPIGNALPEICQQKAASQPLVIVSQNRLQLTDGSAILKLRAAQDMARRRNDCAETGDCLTLSMRLSSKAITLPTVASAMCRLVLQKLFPVCFSPCAAFAP